MVVSGPEPDIREIILLITGLCTLTVTILLVSSQAEDNTILL
jgi:hypothetical protein